MRHGASEVATTGRRMGNDVHASRWAAALALTALGCVAPAPDPSDSGRGGSNSGGGGSNSGGSPGTGGAGSGGSGGISAGLGGTPASGGSASSGGSPAAGGSTGAGGTAPGTGGTGSVADAGNPPADASAPGSLLATKFSFFVTSMEALVELSGNPKGFGGNLGGLAGADKICQMLGGKAGAPEKTWRAFLSVVRGADGQPEHAINRIGEGPWYDRKHRLIAMDKRTLVMQRPGGDAQATFDLVNENGERQMPFGDNHDVVTGSNAMGLLRGPNVEDTCRDWTNATTTGGGRPICGHSWSRGGPSVRQNWIAEHVVPGCAPGINLRDNTVMSGGCIGCNGGYGAFYCFATTP